MATPLVAAPALKPLQFDISMPMHGIAAQQSVPEVGLTMAAGQDHSTVLALRSKA